MPGVGNQTQLIDFDLAGIAVSAGSACSSGKVGPSHVLAAMGVAAGGGADRDPGQPGLGEHRVPTSTAWSPPGRRLYARTRAPPLPPEGCAAGRLAFCAGLCRHNGGRTTPCETDRRHELQQVLSLTPAAVGRVRQLLDSRGDGAPGIRIGVRTAGCSGLTYTIDFVGEIKAGDEVIEADGVKVVVDPAAVMYLVGTEMDFVQDKLGAAFKFSNPNESGRCGCGESFTV